LTTPAQGQVSGAGAVVALLGPGALVTAAVLGLGTVLAA